MGIATHGDHEQKPLSTASALSASERDNAVRFVHGQRAGHVESHFLKANAPDGSRALWIKHTLLVPATRPDKAVAEIWAIGFVRGSKHGAARLIANKRTFPIAQASWSTAPFSMRVPCAELGHGHARGELTHDGPKISWELAYACPDEGVRPFPFERMYTGPFPKSKTLTPVPDTRMQGVFTIDGERWNVDAWSGAQGHNWGRSHAHAYAWAHGNAFEGEGARNVWLEALSGRVRLGPVVLPWLHVACLHVDGRLFRFDGPRAMLSRTIVVDARSYRFELRSSEATLRASFRAETSNIAGLRYEDPDGSSLSCLNSKLAYGEVHLSTQGRTWSFKSDQVALELGTRREDHGVTILV